MNLSQVNMAQVLVIGAIACATGPAATEDTIRQSATKGGFPDTLRGIVARAAGGMLGGALAQVPRPERPWFGLALLPQAGVAVSMALVAAQEFPEYAETLLTLVIGTTVLFELIGPLFTMLALRQVARKADSATGGARGAMISHGMLFSSRSAHRCGTVLVCAPPHL